MGKVSNYFKETVVEMKKVVWPSKEEVKASAKVVIITLIGAAVILGLFDLGVSELVKIVYR